MSVFTLPRYVWSTPEEWGPQTIFCGSWDELCTIAADLRSVGIQAEQNDAVQYHLVGADDRGLPRGWYSRVTYETSGGKTKWCMHCVELDINQNVLRECYREEPQVLSNRSAAKREMMVRCLADA